MKLYFPRITFRNVSTCEIIFQRCAACCFTLHKVFSWRAFVAYRQQIFRDKCLLKSFIISRTLQVCMRARTFLPNIISPCNRDPFVVFFSFFFFYHYANSTIVRKMLQLFVIIRVSAQRLVTLEQCVPVRTGISRANQIWVIASLPLYNFAFLGTTAARAAEQKWVTEFSIL